MHLQAAVRAGFIAILGSVVPSASGLAQDVRHIVVNVVNEAGVSATVLEDAHRRVIRIFETIGVAVVCTHTYVADSEAFIVKIVDERAAECMKAPAGSVGIALTGSNGGGRFAYLFYDRIEHLSDTKRLDVSAVLGAAIAHELGHLLLPVGSHTSRGVMRGDWSRADLLTADGPGLRFTAEQGALIPAQLESRTRRD